LNKVEFRGWDVNASVADGAAHAGVSRWATGDVRSIEKTAVFFWKTFGSIAGRSDAGEWKRSVSGERLKLAIETDQRAQEPKDPKASDYGRWTRC